MRKASIPHDALDEPLAHAGPGAQSQSPIYPA